MRPGTRRDRLAWWLFSRLLASPPYRARVQAAITYGLASAARDKAAERASR